MIYVKVKRNSISAREIGDSFDSVENAKFTTTRLLVGEFKVAEAAMKILGKRIREKHKWWKNPFQKVLIHPLDMAEGGLSEVEERLYNELVVSSFSGVKKVKVWTGNELTDRELKDIFQESKSGAVDIYEIKSFGGNTYQ